MPDNIDRDTLQNELIIIAHHVDDIKESLRRRDIDYALGALDDIKEVIERLSSFLTDDQKDEIERIADSI